MFKKIVFLGADHGGFSLKESIKKKFDFQNIEYYDLGTFNDESVNYVDYAKAVSEEVFKNNTYGVLCCSSGIGMSIAANKMPGIRAALCVNDFHAEFSRRHNNANIICFGQKITSYDDASRMLDIFLNTEFDGGRHKFRLDSISKIEEKFILKENA